jgi:predicted  nucleic acid-binding Zn-ribbon protein
MNLETAKQLLKKAILLDDAELLELANAALEQASERAAPVQYPIYSCKKCGHKSDIQLKSCPSCRGRKFKIIDKEEKVESTPQAQSKSDPMDFTIKKPEQKNNGVEVRYNPDTGEAEGSYGRREEVKAKQFDISSLQNEFNTIPTEGNEDETDKKIKEKLESKNIRMTQRRPPAKMITVKCYKCSKDMTIPRSQYRGQEHIFYLHDRCATKSARI